MNPQQIEQLSNIIKQNVTIDKRNIENLLDFLISMLQAKDINLGNMVDYSRRHNEIQENSIYKKLIKNCRNLLDKGRSHFRGKWANIRFCIQQSKEHDPRIFLPYK